MNTDEIRKRIADKLSSDDTHELWADILQDTSPGNYGAEMDYVFVAKENIQVNQLGQNFTFKNLDFQFSAQLGASNPGDGYEEDFKFTLSGTGTFQFLETGHDLEVDSIHINEELDLYSDQA